ncbi:MAG: acyl-CoA mutase large subunit family protein [Thermodesulfobacteriota bacterium]
MSDTEQLERIKEAKAKYDDKVAKALQKMPERKADFVNTSGIPINRVYTPLDMAEFDYLKQLGLPGAYPYTRAVQPTAYRGRFWTMRQYAGFATAEETNERYHFLLKSGQTGLSVAFDLPTQIGYDSDHPLAQGEVGKVGVAIDSLWDMERLFQGIPLDQVSTSMTINSPCAVIMAMYLAVAEKQGVPFDKLRGTVQNDILKEYPARGTYIFAPRPSMRLITDIFAYCTAEVPQWNTISISGYHIREAGSTAVQEVAFTLANGIAYVEAAIAAGMKVDEFGPRLSFFFNSHSDFLEEVAKFRAARRLWAKIMKERFGAADPRSQMLRFHTQTAGCSLTAQQPLNNIMRVAFQAMSAVLGGTQSLHTNSFDEALALPSELAVQVALRTQQVVAYETNVCDTIDPLAGSYYLENLTDAVEAKAQEYIDQIDRMGGAVAAIEKGFIQKEIAASAYKFQQEVEKGQRIIVGLNRFQTHEEKPTGLLKVDPEVGAKQIARLQELKNTRDNAAVAQALAELKAAAQGTDPLMPPILKAVKNLATLGEVCDTLREVFGEYEAPALM